MATNQMRREAAKRKLERQQERRAEQTRRRQRVATVTSVGVVILVVVGVVLVTTLGSGPAPDPAAAPSTEPSPTAEAPATEPAALGECTFVPGEPAVKPAPLPTVTTASTEGTAAVTLQTDRGAIPLVLDRAQGPCAVESFLGLAAAAYYDGTPCHRLTTGATLRVLQCGDPTGSGQGGPGYTFNEEPPTTLAPDPSGQGSVYPRGTLAMAKTQAPNSSGSQFFLVYADSVLPPEYTVFGSIAEEGLATLDQIAAAGTTDGAPDGAPAQPVTITQAVPA